MSHDFDHPPGMSISALRQSGPSMTPSYPLYTSARGLGSSGSLSDWDHIPESPSTNSVRKPNNAPIPGGPSSPLNHHHLSSPPSANSLYSSPAFDHPSFPYRRQQLPSALPQSQTSDISRSTLWWGELEPWMDEEYAKQVCALMGWDPVHIRVPHPAPDPVTGQQANNPGYCFLTFPSPTHAATVLSQINDNPSPLTMPNSSRPFTLNWATSVPSAINASTTLPMSAGFPAQQQFAKEHSIFVGDLAPETSNSDLVAVFRNPVLGLRNDREPKFIRPFLSCKSAKIMLDPVTGLSRGYGFVRFTDEADQQRALIEMHGLYCLSRPMRISPATAKFKPPSGIMSSDLPQAQFPIDQHSQPAPLSFPVSQNNSSKSVSAPIAATTSASSLNSNSSTTSSSNASGSTTLSSSTSFTSAHSADEMRNLSDPLEMMRHKFPLTANTMATSFVSQQQERPQDNGTSRYTITEEAWKHQAQARAILGNLMGPNGEQLTSTDPYNTTVFVGGLSPLISEDTLRTFFAPFGDIHYVKVPAGKHCGFVQFVRKVDAERAIEKMQGFPVGGSRIRLSWGRSQYKAAQAAAQAAQAASFQTPFPAPSGSAARSDSLTQEQVQMLQKIAQQGYLNQAASGPGPATGASPQPTIYAPGGGMFGDERLRAALLTSREDVRPFEFYPPMSFPTAGHPLPQSSSFSPFSPDPNVLMKQFAGIGRDGERSPEALPHPSKAYAPGGFPSPTGGDDGNRPSSFTEERRGERLSPTRMGYLKTSTLAPISRPSSGQASLRELGTLNGTLASLDLNRERS